MADKSADELIALAAYRDTLKRCTEQRPPLIVTLLRASLTCRENDPDTVKRTAQRSALAFYLLQSLRQWESHAGEIPDAIGRV